MIYIHLSGRDLAKKLNTAMKHIRSWRVDALTALPAVEHGRGPQ